MSLVVQWIMGLLFIVVLSGALVSYEADSAFSRTAITGKTVSAIAAVLILGLGAVMAWFPQWIQNWP